MLLIIPNQYVVSSLRVILFDKSQKPRFQSDIPPAWLSLTAHGLSPKMCDKRCEMKTKHRSQIIRRSVALPKSLVAEVTALAPPEARKNLNRLVTVALKDFAARQKARAFEESMAKMAIDPAIQGEGASISREFRVCESDGLEHD